MKISELIEKLKEVIERMGDGEAGIVIKDEPGNDLDVVDVDEDGFIVVK